MLKRIVLFSFLIFASLNFYGQEFASITDAHNEEHTSTNIIQVTNDFQNYWTFGGNIGFSFWDNGTSILIGPKAFYNFSPKFLGGFGLSYMYSEFKNRITGYHSNSYGGSLLAAFRPIHYIQLSAEYEGLQTNYSGYFSDEYFNSALYFGLSFVTGPVSFGIRYDVLYNNERSLYSSAWNPFVGFYF